MSEQERSQSPGLTRFARRGVARLAYETRGEGARTVVLLHDLLADRTTLHGLRDALVGTGFRVLLPDLRGHGTSAAIAGLRLTIADLVLDLLAILQAEAVERASVVGIGLGATIGVDLALVEPARLDQLVLIDPLLPGLLLDSPDAGEREAAEEARAAAAKIAELANKGSVDRALDLYYGGRWGPSWRSNIPKARLGAMRRHANAFGPLLATVHGYRPAVTKASSDAVPTLILLNMEASDLERSRAERLRSILPSADLEQRNEALALTEVAVRFITG